MGARTPPLRKLETRSVPLRAVLPCMESTARCTIRHERVWREIPMRRIDTQRVAAHRIPRRYGRRARIRLTGIQVRGFLRFAPEHPWLLQRLHRTPWV